MSRRSPGEGSIYKEGNRWRAAYTFTDPATGQAKTARRRARTKTEATALLQQMRFDNATGHLTQAKATVAEAAEQWLEVVANQPVRGNPGPSAKTLSGHRDRCKLIKASLGNKRLTNLTVADVDRFLCDTTKGTHGGRANKRDSVKRIRATLIRILDDAKRRSQIGRNVATDSALPNSTETKKEKTALSVEDRDALLTYTSETALGVLVLLCGYFALRPAEARALTWDDLEKQTISINKQLNNDAQPTAPKTKRANRRIGLDKGAVEALKRWKKSQARQKAEMAEAWHDLNLIITSEVGTSLDNHNIRRYLHRACGELGIPKISGYELRHTALTILSTDNGVNNWELADYAGTSTRVIEDTYRHPNNERVLTLNQPNPTPITPT